MTSHNKTYMQDNKATSAALTGASVKLHRLKVDDDHIPVSSE